MSVKNQFYSLPSLVVVISCMLLHLVSTYFFQITWINYRFHLELEKNSSPWQGIKGSSLFHQSFPIYGKGIKSQSQLHELNANNNSLWDILTSRTSSILSDNDKKEATTSEMQPDTPETTFLSVYDMNNELNRKLSAENRKIDKIAADGNCFFRSISKEITGREDYHKAIRIFIVQLIASNMATFAQFIDHGNVDDHVNDLSEDGTWATDCELFAAATLLQRTIYVLAPDLRNQKHNWLLFSPMFDFNVTLCGIKKHPCYVTISNTNLNHFDRIIPIQEKCNCYLPHPVLDG